MSLMFKPPAKDRTFDPNLVQVMLNENALLIKIVTEYQNKGKVSISDFQADENFMPQTESKQNNDSNRVERQTSYYPSEYNINLNPEQ